MSKLLLMLPLILIVSCGEDDRELPPVLPDSNKEYKILPFGMDIPKKEFIDECQTHDRYWGEYSVTKGGNLDPKNFKHQERPYPGETYIIIPLMTWYDFMVNLVEEGVVKRAVQVMEYIVLGTVPVQWRGNNNSSATDDNRWYPNRGGMVVLPLPRPIPDRERLQQMFDRSTYQIQQDKDKENRGR